MAEKDQVDDIELKTKSKLPTLKMPQNQTPKVIDIGVYFNDKTGIVLKVENGHLSTAGDIFQMVIDELQLPEESKETFAMWMVSSLLEVQLKPHHNPFSLSCQWDDLVMRYTTESGDSITKDDPVLVFQRNVYFTRTKEEKITDARTLELLYHEAVRNITEGRYPCEDTHFELLAGWQCLLNFGEYNEVVHTPDFYLDHVSAMLPPKMVKTGLKWLKSKHRQEERLALAHQQAFSNLSGQSIDKMGIQRKYLEFCWKLPFYGSAFFHGQIEKPQGKLSKLGLRLGPTDIDVWVAINRDGVFVIDGEKTSLLLGKLYQDLSWEFAESNASVSNPDCMPCLFLQFEQTESGKTVTKILQIFSKEAVMMDALIQCSVDMLAQSENKDGGDVVDAPTPQPTKELMFQRLESREEPHLCNKLDKLCLATFNLDGSCIDDSQIRTPTPS